MKIAIIGAGPVGCYAGSLFAQAGHDVTIFENHPSVGCPIQCTGILTADFDQFGFPLDSFLVNTINTIEVYSPHAEVRIKQKDYIVCRTKFDRFFAQLAESAGAAILVNHSFQRKEGKTLVIWDSKNKREKRINPDLVLAADGPLSPTAKAYGFYHPTRHNYYGIQAIVQGSFASSIIKTYFGTDVCPDLFAWIVPESSTTARVGIATLKNSRHYFDQFMKEHGFVAQEIQAGAIPLYHPQQELKRDNCYVLGDAAGYVKATTLGGLVPGLKQAKILAESILHGKNYQKELAPLRRQMHLHLRIQKMFMKFSNHDWDLLVKYVAQPKIQAVFERYTRDNPIPLVSLTLLKEPRFLRFLKHL